MSIWENETPLLSGKCIRAMLDREIEMLDETDVLGHQMVMFLGQRLGEQLSNQAALKDEQPYPSSKLDLCGHCGSPDIEQQMWVDMNSNIPTDSIDGDETIYCRKCEKNSEYTVIGGGK